MIIQDPFWKWNQDEYYGDEKPVEGACYCQDCLEGWTIADLNNPQPTDFTCPFCGSENITEVEQ